MREVFERAIQAHQSGNLAEAEQLYREVVEAVPDYAHAYYLQGVLMLAQHEYTSARYYLQQALQRDETKPTYHCALGHVEEHCYDFEKAVNCYRTALKLQPDYLEAQLSLGKLLLKTNAVAEAEPMLQSAYDAHSNQPDCHVAMARLYFATDRFEWGKAACFSALEMEPNHYEANLLLGSALRDAGACDRAENRLREALRIQPENPEVHTQMAILFAQMDKLDWAEAACKTAIEKRVHYREAYVELARVLSRQNKTEEATRAWMQVFYMSAHDRSYYPEILRNLINAGELFWSKAFVESLILLTPEDPSVWDDLSALEYYAGNYEASAQSKRKAFKLRLLEN